MCLYLASANLAGLTPTAGTSLVLVRQREYAMLRTKVLRGVLRLAAPPSGPGPRAGIDSVLRPDQRGCTITVCQASLTRNGAGMARWLPGAVNRSAWQPAPHCRRGCGGLREAAPTIARRSVRHWLTGSAWRRTGARRHMPLNVFRFRWRCRLALPNAFTASRSASRQTPSRARSGSPGRGGTGSCWNGAGDRTAGGRAW